MARNDSSNPDSHTPYKKQGISRDILADFSSCFRLVDKENGLSSADKKGDERSLESEKPAYPGFPFSSPNSFVEKINNFSPRRTTCEKQKEMAESPAYVWKFKSSGKKFPGHGHTPVSIFQNSNEKKPNFLDFQPPSDAKASRLSPDKQDFILPELERQFFNLNMFDSSWGIKELQNGNFSSFNVFLENQNFHSQTQSQSQVQNQNAHPNHTHGFVHPGHSGTHPDHSSHAHPDMPVKEARGRAEPGKCNCRNSQCLKMYCDCLKRGEFCNGCNCVGCENHGDSQIRKKKVGGLFEKSKKAVGGLIVTNTEDLKARVARNGCNCRKNACLKKYCECHQFGLKCGKACRCLTCQNGRDDPVD